MSEPAHSVHGCTRASTGARPSTMRRGEAPGASRTVSCGSSARTVPAPTTMASLAARNSCTRRRAGSPVIKPPEPVLAAIYPSMVIANLSITNGRPVRRWCRYEASCSRTRSSSTPTCTAMPASRSRAMPVPATRWSGSCTPITTRATPAVMIASVQGGVRPKWLHGSSVTYIVAPRAASPAARNACTSACAWPTG